MSKMYKVPPPRLILSRPRQRTVLFLALFLITAFLLVFRGPKGYHVVPFNLKGKYGHNKLSDEEIARKKKDEHEDKMREDFRADYDAAKRYGYRLPKNNISRSANQIPIAYPVPTPYMAIPWLVSFPRRTGRRSSPTN